MSLLDARKWRILLGGSKAISSIGMAGCFFVLTGGLYLYDLTLQQELASLKEQWVSIHHQAVRSQETAQLIKTYKADFKAFEVCQFDQPATVEALQQALSCKMDFGKPSPLKQEGQELGLTGQTVSFSISCLQDKEMFGLVEHLFTQGPGVFQIHEMTFERLGPLTEEMLEKIAAGAPQVLFQGRMVTTWIHR